ncbi:MAG: Fe-Mn family superoxide dismutase [Alteromonas naphthalenivorans]|jgi:Fe-Mn family superoxide dismutase
MYKLPKLPYEYGALEPYIEAQIMELHHGKHQQAYVNGLNAALQKHPELFDKPLVELLKDLDSVPEDIRTAVRNHGGGVKNHTDFWNIMQPKGGGEPTGPVGDKIKEVFGSFDVFRDQLNTAAKSRFGSGWAWLSVDNNGKLVVSSTANQDTPLSNGLHPIIGLDVWEHAYYLQYVNRRPAYIDAWWNTVNWEQVEQNYKEIIG